MLVSQLIKILTTFDQNSDVEVVSKGMDRLSSYDVLSVESKEDSTVIVVRCVP